MWYRLVITKLDAWAALQHLFDISDLGGAAGKKKMDISLLFGVG